jgi:hypothetical protein
VVQPIRAGRHARASNQPDAVSVGCVQSALTPHSYVLQVLRLVKGYSDKQEVPALNITSEEFAAVLKEIKAIVDKMWPKVKHLVGDRAPLFAYDNPNVHKLPPQLLKSTGIDKTALLRPPRYSGDIMQCIEHVHALVCSAYEKERFRAGNRAFDLEQDGEHLTATFYDKVTPEGVAKNCAKLTQLLEHVCEAGTGDYAPQRLT